MSQHDGRFKREDVLDGQRIIVRTWVLGEDLLALQRCDHAVALLVKDNVANLVAMVAEIARHAAAVLFNW